MLSVYTSITSTFHAYIELDTSQRDEQGLIISRKITPLRSLNPGIQPVLASRKFHVINKTWPQILISWHQFKTWPQNLISWHQLKTWPQKLIKWHQFKTWPQKLIKWYQKLITWHQILISWHQFKSWHQKLIR